MISIPRIGTTINHEVQGSFSASRVRLIPASPGTGVVAGSVVRAVLEMAGITDCLTKCYGSTNARNVVKAVIDGLQQIRTPDLIAELRGVDLGTTDIEERIERGKAFMPSTSGEKVRAPVNTVGQDRKNQRGGGRRGGGRGRDSGPPQQQAPAPAPAPAPAADAPPAEAPAGDKPADS